MSSPADVGVVIVAAGRGERAGGPVPKQFRELAGEPLLLRTIRPFLAHPAVGRVVVVLPAAVASAPPPWLAALVGDRLTVAVGGATRADSVAAGLERLPEGIGIAVVHDGARPFVDPAVLDRVVDEARAGRGAVAAVPVADTLKEAETDPATGGERVAGTVSRNRLWRAQTPQAFPVAVLRAGLAAAKAAGIVPTDDAAAVEGQGVPVTLIEDRTTNIKVTTSDDFRIAEALARGPS